MSDTAPRYYRIGEVSRIVGRSEWTVRRWDRLGRLKPLRDQYGARLFTEADLEIARQLARGVTA